MNSISNSTHTHTPRCPPCQAEYSHSQRELLYTLWDIILLLQTARVPVDGLTFKLRVEEKIDDLKKTKQKNDIVIGQHSTATKLKL